MFLVGSFFRSLSFRGSFASFFSWDLALSVLSAFSVLAILPAFLGLGVSFRIALALLFSFSFRCFLAFGILTFRLVREEVLLLGCSKRKDMVTNGDTQAGQSKHLLELAQPIGSSGECSGKQMYWSRECSKCQ